MSANRTNELIDYDSGNANVENAIDINFLLVSSLLIINSDFFFTWIFIGVIC